MTRLPPEFAPQKCVLFSFPRRDGDWGNALHDASEALIAAANAVQEVTPVLMIVGDDAHFAHYARDYTGAVLHLPTDDCWVRDYGPITVTRQGKPVALDFTFRGWGGKFAADRDDRIPALLHAAGVLTTGYEKVGLELEGGSIESDGNGTLLTTTRCLLNPNRNGAAMTRTKMETALREYLGAQRVIWLEHGELIGDDTDAHVDTLARFFDAETIAYVQCDDAHDAHYPGLRAMERELQTARNAAGRPYRLLALPWCPPVFSEEDGHRLPATYANFLISNGVIFVPQYFGGAGPDGRALQVLGKSGTYRAVPVDCRPFIEQHGSLHCLTMQLLREDALYL